MALPDDTLPTNLTACIEVLVSLNNSIADGQAALSNQALDLGFQADSINWILSLLLEALLIILLLDRITALRHRPTRITFFLAVTTSILFDLLMTLGSKVPWFFDITGTYLYYWARGPLAALSQWTISHLLYLRVSDALTRTAGRRVAQICFLLTALVFPLELAKQWYGAIKFTMTGTEDGLYLPALGWFTAAYRFALDLGFNFYAFRVIYGSGVATNASNSGPRSRLMSEDSAFIVGYVARTLLFLASDILFVIATTVGDSDYDISFRTLAIWACSQLLGPIKPYLICTDMARIRGLSADTASPPASADATKVQSSGSKAGQDVSRMSIAKLKTAQMEGEP
ncbi:hypothetical protein HDU89_005880 [Geranomyces variabilis]|nr:hypothetical protein HDU89_005880 [Geranomyces variabilis]